MTRIRRQLAALLAPLMLGACGGPVVTGEYYSALYHPDLVNLATRNGALPTAVYGSPYDAAATRALLYAVELPALYQPARLAMTPAAQQGDLTRLVMVFDPAPAVNDGEAACSLSGDVATPKSAVPGSSRVLLAFCVDSRLASEAVVAVPASGSAPAVAQGIGHALSRVLLPSPPNDRGASCEGLC